MTHEHAPSSEHDEGPEHDDSLPPADAIPVAEDPDVLAPTVWSEEWED